MIKNGACRSLAGIRKDRETAVSRNNPYETLGVPRGATQAEIIAAYKSLAKKYHPDLHPGDAVAAARMQEINEAYNLLKEDPGREADAEQYRNAGFRSDFSASDGGHWEEYEDAEAAQTAAERTERMARAFEEALKQRRRAEIRRTVTRILVWIALAAMLGSILFQACAAPTGGLGFVGFV